jgi:hypothetical protein
MTADARTQNPAGMVLVSGDQDFVPAIETILDLEIPVSVFNPNDHRNYQLGSATASRELFEVSHLTQEIMAACPLGHDAEWIEYLEMKLESRRGKPFEADYQRMFDDEKRKDRNRRR